MDVVYSPFFDKEGNVSGIVVNSRDITRRKLAEEELKKYQYIVSASQDHMSFVDRSYVYLAVNDAYLRDFKKRRDDIVGHSVPDLLGREKFESLVKRKLDQAFGGKQVEYESWFDFPLRGTAFMEVRYSPFYDDENRITGVVVNSRDITERKKTEERLREAQKKEALGTLAGGIAHDFNNILGAIIGCTELTLLDTPPGTPSHSHLTLVRQAAQRAVDLVKQILCFSRQQKGEYKPVKIIPLIKEAMKMVRASLPATIEIRLSIETDNDVVQADLTHIHQMVMNLCTNAAHAMQEKGGLLLLRLAAMSHADIPTQQEIEPGPYIMLAIIDTGHGIEKSIRERIFDPYFTTKEVSKGTGLGLAIVHSIVKNHKGIIELYSEEGKGTTVQVYLPLFKEQAVEEEKREISLPLGNECILFVDDETALAQTGKEILERFGYKVFMKTGSEAALRFFRENPDLFDLVISDQTMPRMTGMELLREIMRIRPGIPMVLCTGYSDSVDADLAESCGISHFMLKPLSVRNLIETVRAVLDKKREGCVVKSEDNQ
jgi:PAS domain S-box-containing protein